MTTLTQYPSFETWFIGITIRRNPNTMIYWLFIATANTSSEPPLKTCRAATQFDRMAALTQCSR
jgi:hypothetical protein